MADSADANQAREPCADPGPGRRRAPPARRVAGARQSIHSRIARRGTPHGSGLGVYRRVIERTIAWYHGMKRLRIRWEHRDDIHEAFISLATCIITYRQVV